MPAECGIQVYPNFDIALGTASTKALLSRVRRSCRGASHSTLNRHHHHIDDGSFAEDAVAGLADGAHNKAFGGFFIHALIWL